MNERSMSCIKDDRILAEVMHTMNALDNWLTSGRAAVLLGLTIAAVHYLRQQGKLHPVKTPLGYLFDPNEVEALAEERARLYEPTRGFGRPRHRNPSPQMLKGRDKWAARKRQAAAGS